MEIFESDNLESLYINMIQSLFEKGDEVEKLDKKIKEDGGKFIKELYSCVIKIYNPLEGILQINGRPYNPAFAVAETLWNITGDTENWLINYNKLYKYYFEGKAKLRSGYGNRIFHWDSKTDQFELVINRFKEEPTTQHADIIIFDPRYDLSDPHFVPCITKIKFRIRNNKLHMSTFMRAQDVWRGFPYDINLLLTIFQLILNELKKNKEFFNLELGSYYHYCDVLRLYKRDYQAANNLIQINNNQHFYFKNSVSKHINLYNECDFEKLNEYKNIIKKISTFSSLELSENKDEILSKIKQYPDYWKDSIRVCLAYCLINKQRLEDATEVVKLITNAYKEQIIEWCKFYKNIEL